MTVDNFILARCLDIAEELIEEGREDEACAYLIERVLPAAEEIFAGLPESPW